MLQMFKNRKTSHRSRETFLSAKVIENSEKKLKKLFMCKFENHLFETDTQTYIYRVPINYLYNFTFKQF